MLLWNLVTNYFYEKFHRKGIPSLFQYVKKTPEIFVPFFILKVRSHIAIKNSQIVSPLFICANTHVNDSEK